MRSTVSGTPAAAQARRHSSASSALSGRRPWSTCNAATWAPSRTATSSRQIESAPPDSITRSGSPGRIRPLSRAETSGRSKRSLLECGPEQPAWLVEALELHLTDVLEPALLLPRHRADDRVRNQHLAAPRAGHDPSR